MKIVAGLGCIDDYIRFVKAGADEFFCGFVPYVWTKQYQISLPLNRREVLNCQVQIGSIEELRILRKMIDCYKVPVKIAFNSLFYLPEQYELILDLMRQCIELKFDTFIVADIALLNYLRKKELPCNIHLSGEIGEVNHFLMETMSQYPITRYIFHRKNTLQDMKSCIDNNKTNTKEFEAFALNEWCHYTGGFCNSLHCDELVHLCKVPYELGVIRESEGKWFEQWKLFHQIGIDNNQNCSEECDCYADEEENQYLTGATGCGLCALYTLKQIGVTHLKLVGRGNYADYMEQDIMKLKHAIHLVNQCKDKSSYIMQMKQELFPKGCSNVCYYR